MANEQQDSVINDQKLQAWLEERIVRLALSQYELAQLKEQIDEIAHHADYLAHKGQALPPAEAERRERLSLAWLAKSTEIHQAFEPSASHPFSSAEELKLHCQTLMEVNERLTQHHPAKRPLRDLYNRDTEPSQAQKTDWQKLAEEARKRDGGVAGFGEAGEKKPLRDLYNRDAEQPEQRDEPDRSR